MKKIKDDLRIGLIGAGGRGEWLGGYAHKPGDGARVVAAVDVNPEVTGKSKARFGKEVRTFSDYRRLLELKDLDAVIISIPDFFHEEAALAFLEVGKAVYLEKPMAITIEGCDRILDCARMTGGKLFIGHNMRHFPVIIKMKELIDAGAIGNLQAVWCRHFVSYGGDAYFKDWHSERRNTTGLLLQKGAHDIDVIHWLAGGFTRRVIGLGKLSVYDKCDRRSPAEAVKPSWDIANWPPLSQRKLSPEIDVEDHNMILMQLDNGVQATYLQCHYTPDACRNYTFIGDAGRIENSGDGVNSTVELYNCRNDGWRKPDAVFNIRELPGSHGGADPLIVDAFIKFARGEGEATTCPIAAREAVATGVMGTESIRNGNLPMEVPVPNADTSRYFAGGQC